MLDAGDLSEKIELLQKQMHVNAKGTFEALVKKLGTKEAAKEKLIDEAFSAGKKSLRKIMKEAGVKGVTEEKLREIVYKSVEANVSGWTAKGRQTNALKELMQMGLSMRVEKHKLKNEVKMQRILGQAGFDAMGKIHEAKGLANRVRIGDKEAVKKASELVKIIQSSVDAKIAVNSLVIVVCIAAIAAIIVGTVITGGIPLIVASAFILVAALMMAAADAYYLYESYQEETPATHDKKLLIASTLTILAALGAIIALTATGTVTFGIVPLIIFLWSTLLRCRQLQSPT